MSHEEKQQIKSTLEQIVQLIDARIAYRKVEFAQFLRCSEEEKYKFVNELFYNIPEEHPSTPVLNFLQKTKKLDLVQHIIKWNIATISTLNNRAKAIHEVIESVERFSIENTQKMIDYIKTEIDIIKNGEKSIDEISFEALKISLSRLKKNKSEYQNEFSEETLRRTISELGNVRGSNSVSEEEYYQEASSLLKPFISKNQARLESDEMKTIYDKLLRRQYVEAITSFSSLIQNSQRKNQQILKSNSNKSDTIDVKIHAAELTHTKISLELIALLELMIKTKYLSSSSHGLMLKVIQQNTNLSLQIDDITQDVEALRREQTEQLQKEKELQKAERSNKKKSKNKITAENRASSSTKHAADGTSEQDTTAESTLINSINEQTVNVAILSVQTTESRATSPSDAATSNSSSVTSNSPLPSPDSVSSLASLGESAATIDITGSVDGSEYSEPETGIELDPVNYNFEKYKEKNRSPKGKGASSSETKVLEDKKLPSSSPRLPALSNSNKKVLDLVFSPHYHNTISYDELANLVRASGATIINGSGSRRRFKWDRHELHTSTGIHAPHGGSHRENLSGDIVAQIRVILELIGVTPTAYSESENRPGIRFK